MRIVLLHAFPLDPEMWEPQRALLAEHDVAAPTIYGRGNTIDGWASSILEEIGEPSLVAIGASMGGGCAVAMARHAPERIRGLVLSGAHAGPDPPERRGDREATITRIQREGAEAVWQGRGAAPAVDELIAVVEALRDRPDDRAVVRSLPVPLLVAAGADDPIIRIDDARSLAASAPLGSFHLVEGAGHLPSLERPDDFNAVLGDWLERV